MAEKFSLASFTRKLEKAFQVSMSVRVMKAMGEESVNLIRVRTRLGWGVEKSGQKRQRLISLTAPYIKQRKRYRASLSQFTRPGQKKSNLTLTGDMLDSMKVTKAKRTQVVIGFPKRKHLPFPKDSKARSRPTIEKVAAFTAKRRPFLNLTDLEERKLVRFYRKTFGDLLKREQLT